MRIEITQDFNDLEATNEDDRRVVAGTTMTVTAERGAQLVGLRIATEIDTPAKQSSKPKRSKPATAPVLPALAPAHVPAQTAAETETQTPAT